MEKLRYVSLLLKEMSAMYVCSGVWGRRNRTLSLSKEQKFFFCIRILKKLDVLLSAEKKRSKSLKVKVYVWNQATRA